MPAIPHYSKSRHWELILGFIIIGGIGAAFGHWFSLQQVHAVYHLADFAEFPIFARCMTIARCTLAVAAMYALSHRILSLMCAHRIPPAHTACTFIPLLAVYLSPKVSCLVAAILLLQVITACYYLHREGGKSWLGHALPDAIVLVILCALHFHYTTMFSPLVSDAPLTSLQGFNTESIPITQPVFRQYINAGQYSFSSLDFSTWAAVMHPPTTLNSTLLQLAAFIFGLPPISVESFHQALRIIQFVLIVGGSFGCYLFLKYALNVRTAMAFTGGALFFLCRQPFFIRMYWWDGGIFLTPFAVFPYALLFMVLAFKKEDFRLCLLAGMALGAQFFLYTPHPEGTFYSLIFFSAFSSGLCLAASCPHWRWKQKCFTLALALASFLLLTAYAILPIVWDRIVGAMYVFSHVNDTEASPVSAYQPYIKLLLVFLPVYLLAKWPKGRPDAAQTALILFALFISLVVYLTSHIGFDMFLVHALSMGLHVGSLPWRAGLYFAFGVLCLAMMTLDTLTGYMKIRNNFLGHAVVILLSACGFLIFPVEPLGDATHIQNPDGCHYYITLQSLLTSSRGMEPNRANEELIKQRLQQFHADLAQFFPPLRAGYEDAYAQASQGIPKTEVMKIAEAVYRVIDRFYLDRRFFCTFPIYDYEAHTYTRRIMRHNLAGLYENLPPYKTILSAYLTYISGPAPGLWINNQSMTFETRFMTAMPLLTALYALPKYDFASTGNYAAPLPLYYYNPTSLSDPVIRRVLDIGGIDVFTVRNDTFKNAIPDTLPLAANVDPTFNPGFLSFINQDSYGLAYLANHITVADVKEVAEKEARIQQYFTARHKDPGEFKEITRELYNRLLRLKEKHDIILETDAHEETGQSQEAGTLQIKGIVGDKALFTSDCKRQECEMVFNISAAPGWHAYVNDTLTTISRANFAFLAVKVPHGLSRIWLVYDPAIQIIGDLLSLIALIAIVLII